MVTEIKNFRHQPFDKFIYIENLAVLVYFYPLLFLCDPELWNLCIYIHFSFLVTLKYAFHIFIWQGLWVHLPCAIRTVESWVVCTLKRQRSMRGWVNMLKRILITYSVFVWDFECNKNTIWKFSVNAFRLEKLSNSVELLYHCSYQ